MVGGEKFHEACANLFKMRNSRDRRTIDVIHNQIHALKRRVAATTNEVASSYSIITRQTSIDENKLLTSDSTTLFKDDGTSTVDEYWL